MNRLGMLVDLSHVSSDAMRQVRQININMVSIFPPGPGSHQSTGDLLTFWSSRDLLLSQESLV